MQIRVIVSMALLMGGIFGTIFGTMRVEEEMTYQIRLALLREEHYCFPIGGILGALVRQFHNECFLRRRNMIKTKTGNAPTSDASLSNMYGHASLLFCVLQTGFASEYIRLKSEVYQSVEQCEFNEDI